jgi:hypothetical protein
MTSRSKAPRIGDLVRRAHCPHVGIIVEARGIYVTVQWVRPFWQADRRIADSVFPRSDTVIISRAQKKKKTLDKPANI